MKVTRSIHLGAWILISLNIFMAFGSIWIFTRMTPAIETIIIRNGKSQFACEKMLSALAKISSDIELTGLKKIFESSLDEARKNITEKQEPEIIGQIESYYGYAFSGDKSAVLHTVAAIENLSRINRNAMVKADMKAKELGNGGAWAIVFMASSIFIAGLLFMRKAKHSIFRPLEEIHSVLISRSTGDYLRRCTGPDMPQDIKLIFNGINDLLDNTGR